MSPFFGPGVVGHQQDLAVALVGQSTPLGMAVSSEAIAGPTATVRAGMPGWAAPSFGDLDCKTAFEARCQSHRIDALTATLGTWAAIAAPRITRDLDVALAQLVTRRIIPAARLAPDSHAAWVDRLARARKAARAHVELLGVIPDVAVRSDDPVHFRQEGGGAIAFRLAPASEPLGTVAIGRHKVSGELLVGRFAR